MRFRSNRLLVFGAIAVVSLVMGSDSYGATQSLNAGTAVNVLGPFGVGDTGWSTPSFATGAVFRRRVAPASVRIHSICQRPLPAFYNNPKRSRWHAIYSEPDRPPVTPMFVCAVGSRAGDVVKPGFPIWVEPETVPALNRSPA